MILTILKEIFKSFLLRFKKKQVDQEEPQQQDVSKVSIPSGDFISDSNTSSLGELEVDDSNINVVLLITPGHGYLTEGKRSPTINPNEREGTFITDERFYEWKYNRKVIEEVARLINKSGNKIPYEVLVPDWNQETFSFDPNVKIGDYINEKARLAIKAAEKWKEKGYNPIYVDVHSNAATINGWSNARGTETWYKFGSEKAKRIAEIFQKHLVQKLNSVDRGVKAHNPSKHWEFGVIKQSFAKGLICILLETGFYDNRSEMLYISRLENITKVAEAIINSIIELNEKN